MWDPFPLGVLRVLLSRGVHGSVFGSLETGSHEGRRAAAEGGRRGRHSGPVTEHFSDEGPPATPSPEHEPTRAEYLRSLVCFDFRTSFACNRNARVFHTVFRSRSSSLPCCFLSRACLNIRGDIISMHLHTFSPDVLLQKHVCAPSPRQQHAVVRISLKAGTLLRSMPGQKYVVMPVMLCFFFIPPYRSSDMLLLDVSRV